MAYNLPDAWDPGFVMPKNVLDEGLERRAFITKMLPRGSYDDPAVGNAGYQVPRYIDDEGYGQGTFTTRWQRSGSYSGPKIPHWLNRRPQVVKSRALPGGAREVTVQPLSDDAPLHPIYEDYGARAAQILIGEVARLPQSQRAATLKTILTGIDKSLWTRTQDIWKRYVAKGVSPADAFPLALARAMSAGVAAEIVNTGLRRTAPQANSLLGLGCYGRRTLARGAHEISAQGNYETSYQALGKVPVSSAQAWLAPVVKTCAPPTGYTWVEATPIVPGHWAPLTPDLRYNLGPCDASGNTPKIAGALKFGGFDYDAYAPIHVWATSTNPDVNNRAHPPQIIVKTIAELTEDQKRFINSALTTANPTGPTDWVTDYKRADDGTWGWPETDATPWFAAFGIARDTPLNLGKIRSFRTAVQPLAWIEHPITKQKIAVHVILAPVDFQSKWDATTNPLALKIWLSTIPDPSGWLHAITQVVQIPVFLASLDPTGLASAVTGAALDVAHTVGKTIQEVHDAIRDKIHELTCDLLKSPAGTAAGAGAAVYVGAPPEAGVKGAQIGAQACGAPPPAPTPVMPVAGSSLLPIAIVGGLAVAAVAVFATRKKKAKP